MAYFLGEYRRHWCFDKDCNECKFKIDCLHYVPRTDVEEENFDSGTEYRLATKNDETSLELRRRITEILMKKGIPEKEAWRIVSLWYLQGWQLKELLEIVDKIHPLEIESIIWSLMENDLLVFLQMKIENEEDDEEREKLIEVYEALRDGEDFWYLSKIDDVLAEMLSWRWTGEVRIGDVDDVGNEKEDEIAAGKREDVTKVKKYLKTIVLAKDGRVAYRASEIVKELCSNGLKEWRRELQRAWEARKMLQGLPIEERMLRYREVTGWLF